MNLTDILLFGRAILGDSGSSDAVKPIFDADLEYLEEFDQMYYLDAGEIQLVEGTFYMVTLGDSVYAAKAKRLVDEETPDWFALYLGNAAIEDLGFDSGEPFFYLEQNAPDGGSERSFCATNGASHVTITKTETSDDSSSDNGLKTVTFDGNINDKETFSAELIFQSGIFVKVLDSVVAADELQELIVTIDTDDGAISNNIKENLIYAEEEAAPGVVAGFWVDPNEKMLMVCFPSDVDMGEGIIAAGTYVLYDENYSGFGIGYVSAFTYGNSVGGSDDSVGEYKQMTFIIPAGSEITYISGTVPDMREGALGFVVIKRRLANGDLNYYYEESLINGFVDEHEDGYLCYRAILPNATDFFRFGLITKEIVDMMEEPIPAGFYLLRSAATFEYGAEVTLFWKNPPAP